MKKVLAVMLAVVLIASLQFTAEATQTIKGAATGTGWVGWNNSAGASAPGQVSLYTWATATFAAAADTFIFNFPVLDPYSTQGDMARLGTLGIETQSTNGDSFVIAVKYEVSYDGTSWQRFTIGTDSTSWVTTSKAADAQPWTVRNTDLVQTTYFGKFPYMRVYIYGYATAGSYNLAGGKIRLRFKQY